MLHYGRSFSPRTRPPPSGPEPPALDAAADDCCIRRRVDFEEFNARARYLGLPSALPPDHAAQTRSRFSRVGRVRAYLRTPRPESGPILAPAYLWYFLDGPPSHLNCFRRTGVFLCERVCVVCTYVEFFRDPETPLNDLHKVTDVPRSRTLRRSTVRSTNGDLSQYKQTRNNNILCTLCLYNRRYLRRVCVRAYNKRSTRETRVIVYPCALHSCRTWRGKKKKVISHENDKYNDGMSGYTYGRTLF